MKPIKFKGHNRVFGENQPEYLPLPAFVSPDGTVLTCWEFTLLERLKVLFLGRVFLRVLTHNRPLQPLLPSVENPLVELPPEKLS